MITSGALLGLFLASYPVKLLLLGRENLDAWSRLQVTILRIHETWVAVMVIAGLAALWRIWGYRSDPTAAPEASRRKHRLLGRIAVVAGVFMLFTAGFVLSFVWVHA